MAFETRCTASSCPTEIKLALENLQPQEGKTYLLVNALGAGEYWGSNVNGDYFPERALMHKGASHGYKTFEVYAHVYKHHVNKDPARAMGSVKVAAYNPEMHRVELLLEIDNEKGKDLIDKVASGEFPDWSMGCRVPYDVCSICGNEAKKVAEYCPDLKQNMNKIAQDGRRHYAINTLPKFFDISEVIIGADKTAKTLKKVASAERIYPSALLGLQMYGEDDGKTAAPKVAVMDKEIRAETTQASPQVEATVLALEEYEPELPKPVLKKLSSHSLGEVLSTLSYSGIVLRPEEFQHLTLAKMGREKLAEQLSERGIVFPPVRDEDVDFEVSEDREAINDDQIKQAVFDEVRAFLPHRSIFEAHIHDRINRMQVLPAERFPKTASVSFEWMKTADSGLLELLGALGLSYFLYRKGFPAEAKMFEQALAKKPWLGPAVIGGAVGGIRTGETILGPSSAAERGRDLHNAHQKLGVSWKTIGTVLGPIGLTYLAGASARRKEYRGKRLNAFESAVSDYPAVIGTLAALATMKGRKMLAGKNPGSALRI